VRLTLIEVSFDIVIELFLLKIKSGGGENRTLITMV